MARGTIAVLSPAVRGYLRSMPIGRGSREQTETGNTMPAAKEKRAMTRQDVAFVLVVKEVVILLADTGGDDGPIQKAAC